MGNQIFSLHMSNGEAVCLHSDNALKCFLKDKGISIDRFGICSAKSLAKLLFELRSKAGFLEPQTPEHGDSGNPRVFRSVEPVFIRLCWRCHVLVQVAQKLSACGGGGLFATIVRALHEDLGLDREKPLKQAAREDGTDAYHFELEQIDSPSYAGLMSMYRTHHGVVDIPDESLDVFRECGLPDSRGFVTSETTELSTTAQAWRWYDMAKALQEKVVKFPLQAASSNTLMQHEERGPTAEAASGWRALSKQELPSEEELTEMLERAGIAPDLYGKGKAKTVGCLLKEVQKGESSLEWHERNSALRRLVEPVFVQLLWHDRVLVEVEQLFADGRRRARNMLLAEKKSPEDHGIRASVMRGLREELNLAPEFPALEGLVHFMQEAYCCVTEHLESSSYPGLSCVYVTHYCAVQVLDMGVPHFRALGMLEDEFETREPDKVNRWRWTPVEEARSAKTKGFPEPKDRRSGGGPLGCTEPVEPAPPEPAIPAREPAPGARTPPLRSRPRMQHEESGPTAEAVSGWRALSKQELPSEEELTEMLERAGIAPDLYGKGKAKTVGCLLKEVQKGESSLEWHERNNALRRLAEPVFVQLLWHDRVLVEVEQLFADGRRRARNMLLAEKKSPEDHGIRASVMRGLREELNLAPEFPALEGLVHFMQEAYCCVTEHLESSSYPGLSCVYVTHYCAVQVLDMGVPHFRALGMLEDEFETREPDKVNRWRWTPVEEARSAKTKGFPEPKHCRSGGGPSGCTCEPMESVPLEPASPARAAADSSSHLP